MTVVQPDLVSELLHVAHREHVAAADAEAGIDELGHRARVKAPHDAWRAAIAQALERGLIEDPVRLPPGALQCHWKLQLSTRGLALVGQVAANPEEGA